jgi:signal transduction histidine kinase
VGSEPQRLREIELWVAWLRLGGVLFAVLEVAFFSGTYPPGYEAAAWALTGALAAGAAVLFAIARRGPDAWLPVVGASALLFDTAVVSAYAVLYTYEFGNQGRFTFVLVAVEAALRYGPVGAVGLALLTAAPLAFAEWWRVHHFGADEPSFRADRITFPVGLLLLSGLIVGLLVRSRNAEARVSRARAREAEDLRDEIGRRVDVLEAANRCARALGSSLEVEQAFGAFIRELRGLVPFERTAIVLVEGEEATTIATAGAGAQVVFPPGSVGPLEGSVLERVLDGEIVVRRDLAQTEFPEDRELASLGLRSELVAPLLLGDRPVGMLSLSRRRIDAFTDEEIELVALLGRLVASAVQNIRAYEGERNTVEELRRLSALRADFVSLVSHELRSPMAAVIGAARTLQDRWRQLTIEQRDAFLALIGDETARLASLIGDVLDTSRIEAGTFSYRFEDVDLGRLVADAVGAASHAQQDVRVVATVPSSLPPVRGDGQRLRQVLGNLIENAVKYSPEGGEVHVHASDDDGVARVAVSDRGPGIPADQQQLIFDKFGRAEVSGGSKPGSGLGLYIARSIAEAHGGTLEVSSRPGEGATFTLTLPAV